jgi:indole-3-glycerol phosphate synthase
MTNILETIIAAKRIEIAAARQRAPEATLRASLSNALPVRDMLLSLRKPEEIQIIAEVKKASPSAGVLRADFDPVEIARVYAAHGAAAVSVLTDASFFQGNLRHLSMVRVTASVPVLRKDFIIDAYQMLEARAAGADAVLLIAEILDDQSLPRLVDEAKGLGMQALVEFHEAANLPRVLDCGSRLVGINNRDLRNFTTRLEHTLDLLHHFGRDHCVVSESGIRTRADLLALRQAGVQAVLIGETLMRSRDIGAKLDELRGVTT